MGIAAQSEPSPSAFQLRTVILATNFGEESGNTGKYAAVMARNFGADLLVVHTFVLTQGAMEAEAEQPGSRSAQRAELEAALSNTAQKLGTGLRHSSWLLLDGDAVEEQIPRVARQHEPAMIVLGTHGRGRMGRLLVESASEKILRAAGGPALTVGPNVPPCCEGDPPIRRVLYATALSPQAARGAVCAAGIADAFRAQMDVLHVIHPEDVEEAGTMSAVQARFQAAVAAMVPQHAGFIAEPHAVVATGTAHTRILEYIREHSIDLLVLSLHRTSHLWIEPRRSGAFDIISNAACPVLTVVG